MTEPLIIIGAGGFGREVHDIVVAINRATAQPVWDFLGFVDDGDVPLDRIHRRGARLMGTTSVLPTLAGNWYVVAVGDPSVRAMLVQRADSAGLHAATLIHPSATMGLDVEIGDGSIICSHVSITTNIRIGRHVHLDQNVTVGHDVSLGNYSRVNPGATISGEVVLEHGATVGTNAAVIQGLTLGTFSLVGAGAAVVRDVASRATVVGVPARALSVYGGEAVPPHAEPRIPL
jgi:sugar O-acyltransferase (sialic acid O-acetyltransferase NeuD family)